jgi:hypothetical protein
MTEPESPDRSEGVESLLKGPSLEPIAPSSGPEATSWTSDAPGTLLEASSREYPRAYGGLAVANEVAELAKTALLAFLLFGLIPVVGTLGKVAAGYPVTLTFGGIDYNVQWLDYSQDRERIVHGTHPDPLPDCEFVVSEKFGKRFGIVPYYTQSCRMKGTAGYMSGPEQDQVNAHAAALLKQAEEESR